MCSDFIEHDNHYRLPYTLLSPRFDDAVDPILPFLIDEDELYRAKLINPATISIHDDVTHTFFSRTGQVLTLTLRLVITDHTHNS